MKHFFVAVALVAGFAPRAHAQYLFTYSIFQQFTASGDGQPFSNPLCSNLTTSSINYDDNPATSNAKISTDLCPAIGPDGQDFGAQFNAYLFTWTPGIFFFYVGADDAASLYIDGQDVLNIDGHAGYVGDTVQVALTEWTHTFQLDYYATDDGDPLAKTIQSIVDPALDVSTFDETTLFHGTATPEPSSLALLFTGLVTMGAGVVVRRRRATARARALPLLDASA
ncbi:MAG TPA: PEP-CTERM sorting domain-containing protein [Gemmatimonadaceae bacterium]|nr:PEP-CTERM sorting domain-containing protein [Gemmatimonadaceae bacterium]